MADFAYQDPFPLEADDTAYRHVCDEHVAVGTFEGREILKVEPAGLERLAREAMREIADVAKHTAEASSETDRATSELLELANSMEATVGSIKTEVS